MENKNKSNSKKIKKLKPFTLAIRENIIEKYKYMPRTIYTRDALIEDLKKYNIDFITIYDLYEELELNNCDDEVRAFEEIAQKISSRYEKGVRENLMKILCPMEEYKNLANICLSIIASTESMSRMARELPVTLGMQYSKDDVNIAVARELNIIVEQTKERWLKVKLPFLLPKKEKGSSEYLRDVLYCALQDYFSDREPVEFDHSVIVIKHVYGKDRRDRMRCDHDNFEINFITDAIALFALPDDSPEHCKMFSYSVRGEKEHSCIYLVPEEDFIKYYSRYIMRGFS